MSFWPLPHTPHLKVNVLMGKQGHYKRINTSAIEVSKRAKLNDPDLELSEGASDRVFALAQKKSITAFTVPRLQAHH